MSVLALAFAVSAAASPPHLPVWPASLQERAIDIARGFEGQIHFYVEDLRGGGAYGLNADTPAYLASGIKVVVMLALYQALRDGHLDLADELEFRRADVRDGAPLTSYLRPGTPVPIGVLLEAMIQSSDNGATDAVIGAVGLDAVNRALALEGLTGFGPITPLVDVRRLVYRRLHPQGASLSSEDIFSIRVTRPLPARLRRLESALGLPDHALTAAALHEAYEGYYREGWNSASMRAMGGLLAGLARGALVSPAASAAMLEVLRGTRTGLDRVRAGLPEGVTWAHKTGTQHHRTCDFGIAFFPPDERPVVIAASITSARRGPAEAALAALARATAEALTSPLPAPRSRAALRFTPSAKPRKPRPSSSASGGRTSRPGRRASRSSLPTSGPSSTRGSRSWSSPPNSAPTPQTSSAPPGRGSTKIYPTAGSSSG